MKKVVRICFLLVVIWSCISCGEQTYEDTGEEFQIETDYQEMYRAGPLMFAITESPSGYYYMDGHFLFYADKEQMEMLPLCNRVDCLHEKETDPTKVFECNAYFGFSSSLSPMLQYYDGNIYTIEGLNRVTGEFSDTLVRVSLDGSTRTALKELSGSHKYIIHRGYLYDAKTGIDSQVQRWSMRDLNGEPETIYISDLESSNYSLTAMGTHIYLQESTYIEEEERLYIQIIEFQTQTKNVSILFEGKDQAIRPTLESIREDYLYYKLVNTKLDFDDPSNKIIYRSLLDGSQEALFRDMNVMDEGMEEEMEHFISFYSDGRFYYEEHRYYEYSSTRERVKGSFQVFDSSNACVVEHDIAWLPNKYELLIGGENHLFIFQYEEDNQLLYSVDKSQMEEGIFEPVLVSEKNFSETTPRIFTPIYEGE